MASSVYDDDSSDSNLSQDYVVKYCDSFNSQESVKETHLSSEHTNNFRVIHKLINRQIYGRVTRNSRAKTERIFDHIHYQCRYKLDQLITSVDLLSHIFMGFTLCGQFFISYKEKLIEDTINLFPTIEYELYIWRFVPGEKLKYISSYRIFKLLKGPEELDKIVFMQFPTDPYKLICYGLGLTNPVMAFLTILTLPTPNNCKYCKATTIPNTKLRQGWCRKHGFMLHYMFSLAQPAPTFDPQVSLAYPDHLVINTGHYIHILNVSSSEPPPAPVVTFVKEEDVKTTSQTSCTFADNFSEVSESTSDHFSTNSVVEAILEDFSEYDLEGNDCNKPFHELNISCEPLNVTGKSYHNTLVQNIVDPRLKRLQNAKDCIFSMPHSSGVQKSTEKSKIDKKIAEKAYEFIEENEKYEKLSSFRKKRLADKKYEFSEDNSENIVPFNSLRKERRYLHRTQNRCIRSPDLNSLFLSPRSPGIRSPMQSPNSRNNGQFSPGGARNLYSSVRNSPHHSKSPISPRESARKFNVYSPSLDSDCSDYESKLVLRPANNSSTSHNCNNDPIRQHQQHNVGLLIVDSKREESSKWIKKVVRRYSSMDFEDSSLVSGQSRDDYNIPIEIPLIVQTLTEQQLDIVPEFKADQVTETQLIITQRTFDCEQFVQRRAQKLCSELHLEFLHCEDYDIKLLHICPIDGHIVCQAVIKIGALQVNESHSKPDVYIASCIFTWNIATDAFELIEPPDKHKLQPLTATTQMLQIYIPSNNHKKVLVMDFNCRHSSKKSLRDYQDNFEVTLESKEVYRVWQPLFQIGYSTVSDSE